MKNYLILFAIFLVGCEQTPDFKTFPKIDAHVHLDTSDDSFVELLKENSFKYMTLVTRSESQDIIDEEFNFASNLQNDYPELISFATTFSMDGFGEPGWEETTINWLKESFDRGAIAVKVWKDIGMTFVEEDSSFIMMNDERFDPIWDFVESQNKTLVNHVGEPKNCWLPLEDMTVRGDSSYFANNPQYHMYLFPEAPGHEDQLAARDDVLDKHPNIRFVGCHLGSLEYDVDEQAKRLDKYPNFSLDMAGRINHFKVQDRNKVRDFIIKYQDRLLYGTDIKLRSPSLNGSSALDLQRIIDRVYLSDWEYFTTDAIMTQNDKVKEYQGLDLPLEVLKKIYYDNVIVMYPEFGQRH
ncbi:MAG: amidohydrolase family protein [Bacteroidales bacterium]|nr:amidohydrolase family protein [Bacteroidales bacterium]